MRAPLNLRVERVDSLDFILSFPFLLQREFRKFRKKIHFTKTRAVRGQCVAALGQRIARVEGPTSG